MKKRLLLLWLMCCSLIVQSQAIKHKKNKKAKVTATTTKNNITYKIISVANSTFGYDIYDDNKLIIHQYTKPSLSGNEGFTTKEVAIKVAKLVILKVKKGQMPPSVSETELKQIGAIQ